MHRSLVVTVLVFSYLAPVQAQEDIELYFPNVVSGRIGPELVFNNVFVFANDGDQDVQIPFEVLTNEGLPAEEDLFDVAAGEVESFGGYSWMPFLWPAAPREVQGWARIRLAEASAVRARQNLTVRNYDSFKVLAAANTKAVAAGTVFQVTLPDVVTWFDPIHAMAIVNPSSQDSAEVTIAFTFHGAGTLTPYLANCQTEIAAPPLHRVTRFLQDDLCERGPQRGWPPAQLDLTLSSDQPIAVSVMEFSPSTSGFSDLEVRKLQ